MFHRDRCQIGISLACGLTGNTSKPCCRCARTDLFPYLRRSRLAPRMATVGLEMMGLEIVSREIV
jgi:hypothetical protein